MPSRKHSPNRLFHNTDATDCPEHRLIRAVYHRAKLDLRSTDYNTRRRARYFWQREGLDWRAVRDGRREAAAGWLR